MADFRIEFHDRGGSPTYDRIIPDLRAAILAITRLSLEAINGDLRAGGPLTLAVLEAQAAGASPELPAWRAAVPRARTLGPVPGLARARSRRLCHTERLLATARSRP